MSDYEEDFFFSSPLFNPFLERICVVSNTSAPSLVLCYEFFRLHTFRVMLYDDVILRIRSHGQALTKRRKKNNGKWRKRVSCLFFCWVIKHLNSSCRFEVWKLFSFPIFFIFIISKSFRSVDITVIVMDHRFTAPFFCFHSLMETSVSALPPVHVNVYHNNME